MISAYHSILSYQGDDIVSHLEHILLEGVFEPVIESYSDDKPMLKCIIRYIVMAYSKNSDKVLVEGRWHTNKERIYNDAMLPPTEPMRSNVIYFKDDSIRRAALNWMEFQDDNVYTQYKVLQDLKIEMQMSANGVIKKSNGEIDYTQKFLNAGYATELANSIKALEAELMQNDEKFKDAVREVKTTKSKNTLGVEHYAN